MDRYKPTLQTGEEKIGGLGNYDEIRALSFLFMSPFTDNIRFQEFYAPSQYHFMSYSGADYNAYHDAVREYESISRRQALDAEHLRKVREEIKNLVKDNLEKREDIYRQFFDGRFALADGRVLEYARYDQNAGSALFRVKGTTEEFYFKMVLGEPLPKPIRAIINH